jgi:hypothetical protein
MHLAKFISRTFTGKILKQKLSSKVKLRSYHIVPNHILQKWSVEGDSTAFSVLLAREHVRGMTLENYQGLGVHTVYISPDVRVVFKRSSSTDRWVTMYIEVGKGLSINHLREYWSAIQQWQDFLIECQGPWLQGDDTRFLYEMFLREKALEKRKGKGRFTYIGKRLNQLAEKYLGEYVQDCALFQKNCASSLLPLDALDWEHDESRKGAYHFRRGFNAAYKIMVDMGLKPEDAKEWCDEGVSLIEAGKQSIWNKKGPFTLGKRPGDKVRKQIEQFEQRYQQWLRR